jgi:hypothetical protein
VDPLANTKAKQTEKEKKNSEFLHIFKKMKGLVLLLLLCPWDAVPMNSSHQRCEERKNSYCKVQLQK